MATLADAAPTALATLAPSARRSPGTRATTGRPSQTKTRVLTIWPGSTPSAFATSRTVGISSGNSSSRASARAARRKSATRWTGSGSTRETVSAPFRVVFLMNAELVRHATTESIFRNVNERIAESAQRFDADEAEFVCECS